MSQKKWMSRAFNPAHKGELHRYLGIPQNQRIGRTRLAMLAQDPRQPLAIRRRANLALIAGGCRRTSVRWHLACPPKKKKSGRW